ncbi:hypothetical protein ACFL0A_02400 [Patescibacteria group bacterium]
MQAIIALILVLMGIVVFVYLGQILNLKGEEILQPGENLSQGQGNISQGQPISKTPSVLKPAEPKEAESSISLNTYIISGPNEGETINDRNKVSFGFQAKVSPEDTEGNLSFETKVEGINTGWVSTTSEQREITFPTDQKEYTFFVRTKLGDLVDKTPAKRSFKINISPYFGKVKIYNLPSYNSSHPSSFQLSANLDEGEKINITDWKINGNKGIAIITQGIETYLPYGSTPIEDIFIKKSDTLYLWNTSSPIGINKNFRTNKCFGFLMDTFNFSPYFSVSKKCPSLPKLEELLHLSEYCQEFILRMGGCQVPDYSDNIRVVVDSKCTSYIGSYAERNFNYLGCYQNYYKDKDFLNNEWHIFLGHNIISEFHDIIYLRDKEGLVVDKYVY